MKIQNQERTINRSSRSTFVDPHPHKEREMLDKDGNVIDPRTKQIIKKIDKI